MKKYLLLLLISCLFASSKADWVRVWADDFDWNGGVDTNKWDFDEGGDGWGSSFILPVSSEILILFFLGNNEEEYYTRNRMENSRCELFPGSPNGRLIIQARKVRSFIEFSLHQIGIS